jgi:acetylornithine deacetylase/succinyl-diaminopimelate desuccinylase-like protein
MSARRLAAAFGALALVPLAALAAGKPAKPPPVAAPVELGTRPDQVAFRATYKELVETNTTLSAGSCTLAAERMAARLKAAGYPDEDIHLFSTPEHPKEGGLVAILHGTDPKAKAILLLAHIDVVEANRADWTRDPFSLIEENGYFYARGASDDKAMAAVWVDTLIRYRQEGFKPRRSIKLALTCGEETEGSFNGAEYLATQKRDWVDAQFALNEGAGGRLDEKGNRVMLSIQAGEKTYQDYRLEVTNPGGHSSRPVPNNAIYHLAGALTKVSQLEFPVQFNDATRLYFTRMADIVGGENGAAMKAIVANPQDEAANAILSKDPSWHSMLRTTCVATMASAGHAPNALPQRASANVNCRIFPGVSPDAIREALARQIGDPEVTVTLVEPRSKAPPAPALNDRLLGPVNKVAGEMWPGVPIVPTMSTGATDGVHLNAAGIPTYGLSGMFGDPDGNGVHGLNERIRVRSLYEGRDFLYRVVKLYAMDVKP